MDQQEIIKITTDFLGNKYAYQIEAALGETNKELLQKLAAAKTIEEFFEVYYEAPKDSTVERQALEKIEHLLLQKLEAVQIINECLEIYEEAPEGSDTERQAFAKAMSLATNVDELRCCFYSSSSDSEETYACIRAIAALLSAVPVA